MVRTNIQTFSGEVEILSNLHVGSNLVANDTASNVLSVTGAIGANIFIGDGGLLSNIATTLGKIVDQGNAVANVVQFSSNTGYDGVGIVTDSNVGIQNTNPAHTLSIGDKVYFDDNTNEALGESVMVVDGRINAARFQGDGGLLSNIATTLQSIVDQGNVSANVVRFSSNAEITEFRGTGLVTDSNVGIQNTYPLHNLSVGSNLFVDDVGSNVLTIIGDAHMSNLNLGQFTVVASYGLDDVTATSNGTTQVVQFQNTTTSLVADSNIVAAGNVTALQLISTANTEVGDRLKFSGSNVYIDTLRVADVASNLVTYDRATGELTDSGGTFSNKFAVVSKQPPSVLSANATTVTNHGTYTLTTSNLATNSNTFNAFDGTATGWVSSENYNGGGGGTVFHQDNLTQLSNLHPTQFGDWLAVEFPYKTTLRHMKLTPLTAAQYPTSANLYATNNDLTWSEIKYWKDVDPVTDSNVQTIVVNATEQFKKYALVATKAKSAANVAIQDWQLFTESFSIDGGKVAMAQQAATGGETVMNQSGPHSRLPKTVPLKKYPEVYFDFESGGGKNDLLITYKQAGYTVTASSSVYDGNKSHPFRLFDGRSDTYFHTQYPYYSTSGVYITSSGTAGGSDGGLHGIHSGDSLVVHELLSGHPGEYVTLELPKKIKLSRVEIHGRSGYENVQSAEELSVVGSHNGTDWELITTATISSYPSATIPTQIQITTSTYYKYFGIICTKTGPTDNANNVAWTMSQLWFHGYEEDIVTTGDTAIDLTFTSKMNTPQLTGSNVYVDGRFGESFTNMVTGPTSISNTNTSYNLSGKYWDLDGTLESNIIVESNTFLSGDNPYTVSVWFNSSNLEANVSNSCIFSINSDHVKLRSEDLIRGSADPAGLLELKSNTWHNIVYTHEGQGGLKNTYLDGNKVVIDGFTSRADTTSGGVIENTSGKYPPFYMSAHSQNGYVVSSNHARSGYHPYDAFDGNVHDDDTRTSRWFSSSDVFSGNAYNGVTTDHCGTFQGAYLKLQFPFRFVCGHIVLWPRDYNNGSTPNPQSPKDFKIIGSNDNVNWDELKNVTSFTDTGNLPHGIVIKATKGYKYLAIVVTTVYNSTLFSLMEMEYHGYKEGDLTYISHSTNGTTYPHINMIAQTDRGYVATASSTDNPTLGSTGFGLYPAYTAFNTDKGSEWLNADNRYTGGDHTAGETTMENSNTWTGDWLQIEMPFKIRATGSRISRQPGEYGVNRSPKQGAILGSNDGNSWQYIHNWSGLTVSDFPDGGGYKDFTFTTPSGAYYKYYRLVIENNMTGNFANHISISEWKILGAEESIPIPIQIGGGNIDRISNFRIYNEFIHDDKALEIWDGDRGTLREAKSSMTLYKGRVGIGVTEPSAELEVVGAIKCTKGIQDMFAASHLTGGGTISCSGNYTVTDDRAQTYNRNYIKWSSRFIWIPINTAAGYVSLFQPTYGKVRRISPRKGGTLADEFGYVDIHDVFGIPITYWDALYYDADNADLVLIDYRANTDFTLNSRLLLIAARNDDSGTLHIPANGGFTLATGEGYIQSGYNTLTQRDDPIGVFPDTDRLLMRTQKCYTSLSQLAAYGTGAEGWYYVKFPFGSLPTPFLAHFRWVDMDTGSEFTGSPALVVWQASYNGTADVNLLNYGIPFNALMVQRRGVASGTAKLPKHRKFDNTGNSPGGELSNGGTRNGYRIYLGAAGGHGIYNTSQSMCSWTDSGGSIGAGYNGSTCGSFPNGLLYGTGTSGSPNYTNLAGEWHYMISWDETDLTDMSRVSAYEGPSRDSASNMPY